MYGPTVIDRTLISVGGPEVVNVVKVVNDYTFTQRRRTVSSLRDRKISHPAIKERRP